MGHVQDGVNRGTAEQQNSRTVEQQNDKNRKFRSTTNYYT